MLKAVTMSRKGAKSSQNEDASIALPAMGVFAVADGVGGNPAGEFASRQTVDTLYREFKNVRVSSEIIVSAIRKANSLVHNGSGDVEVGKGMASTLVLAWRDEGRVTCYSAGDSRVYRYRDQKLTMLTNDHVKLVMKGNKPKNLITRAVGLSERIEPEITEWDWKAADVLLLMSDGISDQVDDSFIERVLRHDAFSMADKAKALIDESEKRGGRDDKTIVLAF